MYIKNNWERSKLKSCSSLPPKAFGAFCTIPGKLHTIPNASYINPWQKLRIEKARPLKPVNSLQ